jgi:hypothetical protein
VRHVARLGRGLAHNPRRAEFAVAARLLLIDQVTKDETAETAMMGGEVGRKRLSVPFRHAGDKCSVAGVWPVSPRPVYIREEVRYNKAGNAARTAGVAARRVRP